jgi:hypothetical protein
MLAGPVVMNNRFDVVQQFEIAIKRNRHARGAVNRHRCPRAAQRRSADPPVVARRLFEIQRAGTG